MDSTFVQNAPGRRRTTHGFIPSLMDERDTLWDAAWDQPVFTSAQVPTGPTGSLSRRGNMFPSASYLNEQLAQAREPSMRQYQRTPVPFQNNPRSTPIPQQNHQRTLSTPSIPETTLSYPREIVPRKWKTAKSSQSEKKKKKEKTSRSNISATTISKRAKAQPVHSSDAESNTPPQLKSSFGSGAPTRPMGIPRLSSNDGHRSSGGGLSPSSGGLASPARGHSRQIGGRASLGQQGQWASTSTLASESSAPFNGSQTLPSNTPAPFPTNIGVLDNVPQQPQWGSQQQLDQQYQLQKQRQESYKQRKQLEALEQQKRQTEMLEQQRRQKQDAMEQQRRQDALEQQRRQQEAVEQLRQQEALEQQRRQTEALEQRRQEALEQKRQQETLEKQRQEEQREALAQQQRQQEALQQQQQALQQQRHQHQLLQQQKQQQQLLQQQRRRQLTRNQDPRSFMTPMQRQQSLKEEDLRHWNDPLSYSTLTPSKRQVPRSQSALDNLNRSLEALSAPLQLSPRSRSRFDSSQTEGSDEYDNTTVDESAVSELSALDALPDLSTVRLRDAVKMPDRKDITSWYDNSVDSSVDLKPNGKQSRKILQNATDDDLLRRGAVQAQNSSSLSNTSQRKYYGDNNVSGNYSRDERKYEPTSNELRRERVERWNEKHPSPENELQISAGPMWSKSAQNGGLRNEEKSKREAESRSRMFVRQDSAPARVISSHTQRAEDVPPYSSLKRQSTTGERTNIRHVDLSESDTSGFIDADESAVTLQRGGPLIDFDARRFKNDGEDDGTLKKRDERKIHAGVGRPHLGAPITARQLAERVLGEAATASGSESDASTPHAEDVRKANGSPKLNVNEFATSEVTTENDEYRAQLDVRHFRPEELEVKTVDRAVVIRGVHAERDDSHGSIERSFKRIYNLPKECDPLQVRSMFSPDGILTITAPKKRIRRVTIVDPVKDA